MEEASLKKRALIITTVSGFVQKFERQNVRLLQELGYEVHYAANPRVPAYLYPKGTYQEMGVIFHAIPIIQDPHAVRKNLEAYRLLKRLVSANQISLIHCHTPVGGLLGRLLGRHFGPDLKVIYTAHGFHFYREAAEENSRILPFGKQTMHLQHPAIYRIERQLAKHTDALVTINREDYRAAKAFPLRSGGDVYRIRGAGIDRAAFAPPKEAEREASRKAYHIAADTFWMVSVGELNENKNHAVLLQALMLLQKSGVDAAQMHLSICGDGREKKHLKEQIRSQGLSGLVSLHGYVDPVRSILAGADLFLFPSRREGLGIAAVEALAMGLPVIAADNRGSREYIRDGINGVRVPWDDAKRFAFETLRFMSMDADEMQHVKQAAAASAAPFDQAETARLMRRIYQKVDQSIAGT